MSHRNEQQKNVLGWSELFIGKIPNRLGPELRDAILLQGQQEKLSEGSFRKLDRQLQSFFAVPQKRSARDAIGGIGSRLIRSWRGVRHEVMVVEKGFAYRGAVYRSLSEIARLITGARWSGPRFFGLKESK